MRNQIEFRFVVDHYEVYINGAFAFSADNIKEAENELCEMSL